MNETRTATDKICKAISGVGPKYNRAKGKDVCVGDMVPMVLVEGFDGTHWMTVAEITLDGGVYRFHSADGQYRAAANGHQFVQVHS
jgi:hypothetical protein